MDHHGWSKLALDGLWRPARAAITIWFALLSSAFFQGGSAQAEFTTVINAPPSVIGPGTRIRQSNTQVNVWEGGSTGHTPYSVQIGDTNPTTTNIEFNVFSGRVGLELDVFQGAVLNLYGGSVDGRLEAWNGSKINVLGGTAKNLTAYSGSVVNVASGGVGRFAKANAGSVVNISGGMVDEAFRADTGSVVNISGGSVGDDIYAWDASTVNISGGTIGNDLTVFWNAQVNISGGSLGYNFHTLGPGTVNVSGGSIGPSAYINFGTMFTMSGGVVGQYFEARDDSVVNMSGGRFASFFRASSGSTVNVTGGAFGDWFRTYQGSAVSFSGGEFRLDGQLVAGLDVAGSTLAIDIPEGSSLTGTFADGTPFAFSSLDADSLAAGTLTLRAAPIAAIGPANINVLSDPVPLGIRQGQTLLVPAGGTLADDFLAGDGSSVAITGGQVGSNLEAIGAHVIISDGAIGPQLDAWRGSVVDILGGTVGGGLDAFAGSVVNIHDGVIGGDIDAFAGSVVNLSGGTIGDGFKAATGSAVNIAGGEFRLDGAPIAGLDALGDSRAINIPAGSILSGTLADGTSFAFSGIDEDTFADGTLTLEAAELPAIGPPMIHAPSDPVPAGIRAGQTLVVADGGVVPAQFNAGWGSTVTVVGGNVGDDFEAVGAQVTISGGTIEDFSAWNSSVTISAGTIGTSYGQGLHVAGDSVVNISGGVLPIDSFSDHSVVNISGGVIDELFVTNQSFVNVNGGSVGIDTVQQSALNVYSGQVWIEEVQDAVANIFGGQIGGEVTVRSGGVVNISGGTVDDDFDVFEGGRVNVFGGALGSDFNANYGSVVEISGGGFGDEFVAAAGSQVEFAGSDFRVDGELVGGLETAGDTAALNVPLGSLFTGTLADGTPFAFSSQDADAIDDETLTLRAVPYAAGPATIHVPSDAPPLGVQAGQTLVVAEGGTLPDNFNAGNGGRVLVTGGQVGKNFEAAGAEVNISGGVVGDDFDAFHESVINISGGEIGDNFSVFRGSLVNITGGTVGANFEAYQESEVNVSGGEVSGRVRAHSGSHVNISGGIVGWLDAEEDSRVSISGGTVEGNVYIQSGGVVDVSGGLIRDTFRVEDDGHANISGGAVEADVVVESGAVMNISGGSLGFCFEGPCSFDAEHNSQINMTGGAIAGDVDTFPGSRFNVSGGSIGSNVEIRGIANISGGGFGDQFTARASSTITMRGAGFRLDGVLIPGLETPGSSLAVNIPAGSLFTGTLADGTPFAFHSGIWESFANGVLTLQTVALPAADPEPIHVTSHSAPLGVREGETLILHESGVLADHFNAGRGSTVVIDGGRVGRNFEAVGAHVTIAGGEVGEAFDIFPGSSVTMTGGTIHGWFDLYQDASIHISGGNVGPHFAAGGGSEVNISGGEIGDSFFAAPASVVNISGGSLGYNSTLGGTVNISGGSLGRQFRAESTSIVTMFGTDFRLDGQLIPGLETAGNSVPFGLPEESVFTGTLADGTPFSISTKDSDYLISESITLVAAPHADGPELINLPNDPLPLGVHRGQTLRVGNGAELPNYFNAGYGSSVVVTGGHVGYNFEAAGANVAISGGIVAEQLTAWRDSQISVSGGVVGDLFYAREGSTVNISGGSIGDHLNVYDESVVNISGGSVGDYFRLWDGATVNISGGSIGPNFQVLAGARVNILGTVFELSGVPMTELNLGETFTIDDRNKYLSGVLADGTPFSFNLMSANYGTGYFHSNSIVTVTLVPAILEPTSWLLLVSGTPAMFYRRRFRPADAHRC